MREQERDRNLSKLSLFFVWARLLYQQDRIEHHQASPLRAELSLQGLVLHEMSCSYEFSRVLINVLLGIGSFCRSVYGPLQETKDSKLNPEIFIFKGEPRQHLLISSYCVQETCQSGW